MFEIKQSNISGRGLFTSENILKNTIIISIKNPIELLKDTIEGFPYDAVIKIKNKQYIFDNDWKDPKNPPKIM
jgi:hypothetical protein